MDSAIFLAYDNPCGGHQQVHQKKPGFDLALMFSYNSHSSCKPQYFRGHSTTFPNWKFVIPTFLAGHLTDAEAWWGLSVDVLGSGLALRLARSFNHLLREHDSMGTNESGSWIWGTE